MRIGSYLLYVFLFDIYMKGIQLQYVSFYMLLISSRFRCINC